MKKLVVFSGAGISAESGINTFRDSDGLWEQYRIEEVATPEAWAKNPELVQRFYNARRKNILEAQPNIAHQHIARLEKNYDVYVITQNIDDLHERAGSSKVIHLHGNIRLAKSSGPGILFRGRRRAESEQAFLQARLSITPPCGLVWRSGAGLYRCPAVCRRCRYFYRDWYQLTGLPSGRVNS